MNKRPRAAFIERSWPSLNITNAAIANSTGETDLVARVPAAGILQDKDQLEPRDVRSVGEQASERQAEDSECIADRAGEPGCGCRLWSNRYQNSFPSQAETTKETRHQRGSQYRSGGVVLMLIDGESPSPRRRGRETPQIPHFYPKPGSGHCLAVKRGVTKTSNNFNTGKHISSTQHAKRVGTKNRWVFFIIYTNSLPSPLPSLSKPSKRITRTRFRPFLLPSRPAESKSIPLWIVVAPSPLTINALLHAKCPTPNPCSTASKKRLRGGRQGDRRRRQPGHRCGRHQQ